MNFNRILQGKNNIQWYAISKSEMLSKNFKPIETLMKAYESKKESTRQCLTITFSGFDDDAREIFEIMEIRQYVKVLLHKHPSLLYYLAVDTECLQNILLCYCDVETMFLGEKKPISQYSFDDIANDRLPQQNVYMTIDNRTLMNWKREIRKHALKMNDTHGAEIVIADLDRIFS